MATKLRRKWDAYRRLWAVQEQMPNGYWRNVSTHQTSSAADDAIARKEGK